MTLTGPVEVTQGKRRAVSENANIELDDQIAFRGSIWKATRRLSMSIRSAPSNSEPTECRGISMLPPANCVTSLPKTMLWANPRAKEAPVSLTAEHFDMDLGGKHPQPLHGVATGNVHINLESQPVLNLPEKTTCGQGSGKKTLTAGAGTSLNFGPRPIA